MTRILGLDDDTDMLELLRLVLESAGYDFIGTTDGYEALTILRTQAIDLFIQDFMRPGLHGWTVLRRMKSEASLRHIPVLAVSAGPRDVRAEQLKHFDLDIDRDLEGYIQKPYGLLELLATVEAILRRYAKPIPPEAQEIRARGSLDLSSTVDGRR